LCLCPKRQGNNQSQQQIYYIDAFFMDSVAMHGKKIRRLRLRGYLLDTKYWIWDTRFSFIKLSSIDHQASRAYPANAN
jgi:hypothetical protein